MKTWSKGQLSMGIYQGTSSFFIFERMNWRDDWLWGLALIVLNVVIHVIGLALINQKAAGMFRHITSHRHTTVVFALVMGTLTLLVTSLHALEAGIWATAYRLLGALPDNKTAMLYSLNALTSYGHENLVLENRWQLMGAIEALNGWLLFGLTTAFLFGMMEKVWVMGNKRT
ncbi:MAG TPA: hypothetical protein VKR57_10740 [Terriglobales bacterium]|nr:hypothetical protein [Terriglobales bacterium]